MRDRHKRLEGVDNFRDFGGYAGSGGRRVKEGQLYRSAHHGAASDADLEAMRALGVGVIVDLRRGEERAKAPSRRHAAFSGTVIQNDSNEATPDPWLTFIRNSDASEKAFKGYLDGYYKNAPFEPRHVDLFTRYFEALAEDDRPILIHCAAGKDRTGVLVALTHHVLGVGRDDIFEDYLMTNAVVRFDERLPMLTQVIEEHSGRRPEPAAVRAAMAVDAAYLEAAYAAIEAAHGDVDTYLEARLGLTPARRAAIEARLLA